jgi:catechol-2,3-dioxygenase
MAFLFELYKMDNYKIPPGTRIGHIHLKVSDLDKALSFYRDILGFEVMQYYGNSGCVCFSRGLSSSYWTQYMAQ